MTKTTANKTKPPQQSKSNTTMTVNKTVVKSPSQGMKDANATTHLQRSKTEAMVLVNKTAAERASGLVKAEKRTVVLQQNRSSAAVLADEMAELKRNLKAEQEAIREAKVAQEAKPKNK